MARTTGRRRMPTFLAALLLSGAFLSPSLSGQQTMLTVQVTGETGPLGGATVEVLQGGSVLLRSTSDEGGTAVVPGVPASPFDVAISALGYRTLRLEGVTLEAGGTRSIAVVLTPVPIEMEGIVVRAERIQIQRENTEFSTRVEEKAIELLPMAHDVTQIVALTPGARPGHVWGGANVQANLYRLDGLSANHPGMGGELLQPSLTWIDRVEVRGLGAGATYGGFQGGLIDVFTKEGSNEFQGTLRSSVEHGALNNTNLVSTEIGTEVALRYDMEGEARGPLVKDRLFYYLAGRRISQERQALNHLTGVEGRYSPLEEEREEYKAFGKLTWAPGHGYRMELSGAFTDTRAGNFGITGYEGPGATHRYSSPTWLLNTSGRKELGGWGILEARINHLSRDERYQPYGGEDIPGIRSWSMTPPYTSFGNAPFYHRSAPTSTSATLEGTFRARTAGMEHALTLGLEQGWGGYRDERLRNGGMTWLPVNSRNAQYSFDPADPATWSRPGISWVPTQWGGEVRLDADVARSALYAQGAFSLGPRIVLSPGVRWNRWQGWLTPPGEGRFQAVEATGWDPRVGLTVEITRDGSLAAKAHWGRYHQDLISQMFDRVAGGNVFTDEEVWYWRGERFADPGHRFTLEERDALAAQGLFTRESVVSLTETGPVVDYRQPYIDQWLVGVEKQFGGSAKLELLYTRRSNRDMVSLVDRNREANYTLFTKVRVYDESGKFLPFEGGTVFLQEVYLPNWILLERLRCKARGDCPDSPMVPDMALADSSALVWLGPEYALTTALDGRREFSQFQFNIEIERPAWGASLSLAVTDLRGNLDNVSGYTDPETYGPGPYVRINESGNAYGPLDNYAERELKASLWGELPFGFRGGLFWTSRTGDHFSPRFRLSGLGGVSYRVKTEAFSGPGKPTSSPGEVLDYAFFGPVEGHWIFIGPRGAPQMNRRANLDLHLERVFGVVGREMALALDVFNLTDDESVTSINTMVNNGTAAWIQSQTSILGRVPANQYYKAAQERVPPLSLRLGAVIHF